MKKEMKKSGFTLVEIMIVVMIIGLLAAIGIPNFLKARQNTLKKTAINNARQVLSAVDQYALQNALGASELVDSDAINGYLKGGTDGLNIGSKTATLTAKVAVDGVTAENLAKIMYPKLRLVITIFLPFDIYIKPSLCWVFFIVHTFF